MKIVDKIVDIANLQRKQKKIEAEKLLFIKVFAPDRT